MIYGSIFNWYVCDSCRSIFPTEAKAQLCKKRCGQLADFPDGPAIPDISQLELATRFYNALYNAGIMTIKELEQLSDEDLLKIKGLDEKGLLEVRKKLAR